MILNICQLFVASLHFIRTEIVLWLARVLHRRRKQPIVWPSELIGPCVSGKILRLGMARKHRIMGWERESSTNLQPLARANAGLYVVCGSWHELDSSLEWKTSLGSILFHLILMSTKAYMRRKYLDQGQSAVELRGAKHVAEWWDWHVMNAWIFNSSDCTNFIFDLEDINLPWSELRGLGQQLRLLGRATNATVRCAEAQLYCHCRTICTCFLVDECGAKPLQLKASKKNLWIQASASRTKAFLNDTNDIAESLSTGVVNPVLDFGNCTSRLPWWFHTSRHRSFGATATLWNMHKAWSALRSLFT